MGCTKARRLPCCGMLRVLMTALFGKNLRVSVFVVTCIVTLLVLFELVITSMSVKLSQEDVDYFARNIELHYTVLGNGPARIFRAEVKMINNGEREFPGEGWEMFFSQILPLESSHMPYDNGYEKREYGIKVFHWNGQMYSLTPTPDFGVIPPLGNKRFMLETGCCNLAYTDTFPNWYLHFEGFEPRIIANTAGDPYNFVFRATNNMTWKRYQTDRYNPWSAEDRLKNATRNLGMAPLPILPTPLHISNYNTISKVNVLSNKWCLTYDPDFVNEANYLSTLWNISISVSSPNVSCNRSIKIVKEEIKLRNMKRLLSSEEAYVIHVDPASSTISIKAWKPAGVYYAIQSLLSLMNANGQIPQISVSDAPRFPYRGLMIDIARNFHGVHTIKSYIDVLAMYKMNKLHLHLTDDEGWRIEIPGLEELTEIGGKRCHDPNETKCLLPFLGSGPYSNSSGSGFLTVSQYRDILTYAKKHHVEIIPEIDMPGHAHAAIKAMEARFLKHYKTDIKEATRYLLTDLKDRSEYLSIQSFKDDAINPCVKSTFNFIRKVVDAIYNMHKDIQPLKVFHFGGDEVPHSAWEKSPICQNLPLKGNKQTAIKQIFISKVAQILTEYGLNMAAWEDGLLIGKEPISRDFFSGVAYAYTWNNIWSLHGAKTSYVLANLGFKVVMTPATNLYFDHPYEPNPWEPGLIWANRYITTKNVFSVIPENIYEIYEKTIDGETLTPCLDRSECPALVKLENIEGIQGSLFGELVRKRETLDYMVLPRLLALAERSWHAAKWEYIFNKTLRQQEIDKDWTDFANTVGHKEFARLDWKGFLYRLPPPGFRVVNNTLEVQLEFPGLPIEVSKDGGTRWKNNMDYGFSDVNPSDDLRLRTKAPVAYRYSRIINPNIID